MKKKNSSWFYSVEKSNKREPVVALKVVCQFGVLCVVWDVVKQFSLATIFMSL